LQRFGKAIVTRRDTLIAALVADTGRNQVAAMEKPPLVLPLDWMAGFHLGNALSRAVFTQLRQHGVDAGAIRDLSPRQKRHLGMGLTNRKDPRIAMDQRITFRNCEDLAGPAASGSSLRPRAEGEAGRLPEMSGAQARLGVGRKFHGAV